MMKKLRELEKKFDISIKFVAAEYTYAKDLQVQLQRIDNEPLEKAMADARKGFRILRWITRGERKAYSSEERIGQILKEIEAQLLKVLQEKAKELETQLLLVQRQILRIADRFSGELQTELKNILTEEQLLVKLKRENTEKVRSELGALCTETNQTVLKLIEWVAAMEEILRQIKGFESKLEEVVA